LFQGLESLLKRKERRTAYVHAGAEAGTKTHTKQGLALTARRESAATTRRMRRQRQQRQRYPVLLGPDQAAEGICSKTWAVRSALRASARADAARRPLGTDGERVRRAAAGFRHPALVSTPKRKASSLPLPACQSCMPTGRAAPPGETPAFSVDATLGTGHAPGTQHGTAGEHSGAARPDGLGARTQRHVCVAAHHAFFQPAS